MFGVANRRNNIALAGKLASNHLSQAIANTTKYSPNAGEIVMQGMEAKNYKEIAKIKNDAQRDYYAQTGEAKIDGFNDLNAATAKAEGQQRMAGMLAGLGAMSYELTRPKIKPPKPVERQSADDSDVLTALRGRITNLEEDIKSRESGSTKPESSSSGTATDSSASTPQGISPASGTSVSTEFKPWSALGSTIALAEGTWNTKSGKIDYGTFYGGSKFTNFDKHPDIVKHTQSGSSAAAGGFQFMPKTWSRTAAHLNLSDFTPASQEKAARQLTKWRKVDPDAKITTVSQLANTFHKLSPEWAGLPNLDGVSHYQDFNGNRSMAFNRLREHFEKQIGYKLIDD